MNLKLNVLQTLSDSGGEHTLPEIANLTKDEVRAEAIIIYTRLLSVCKNDPEVLTRVLTEIIVDLGDLLALECNTDFDTIMNRYCAVVKFQGDLGL